MSAGIARPNHIRSPLNQECPFMWPAGESYQKLAINNINVAIRIGAISKERDAAQPVEVDVALFRRHAGYLGEGLEECIDYDPIYRYITEDWPTRDHLDLIEAWAEDLVGFCLQNPKVEACRVVLRKTEIFPGSSVPEIELMRYR
jgi:dihydroneopterin aldolase